MITDEPNIAFRALPVHSGEAGIAHSLAQDLKAVE